jgi:hypothetical protein
VSGCVHAAVAWPRIALVGLVAMAEVADARTFS